VLCVQLHHPHVVTLYAFYEDQDNYYLVMELLQGGELMKVLSHQSTFSEEAARRVILQTCQALRCVCRFTTRTVVLCFALLLDVQSTEIFGCLAVCSQSIA